MHLQLTFWSNQMQGGRRCKSIGNRPQATTFSGKAIAFKRTDLLRLMAVGQACDHRIRSHRDNPEDLECSGVMPFNKASDATHGGSSAKRRELRS
jgi:hypothetical protein